MAHIRFKMHKSIACKLRRNKNKFPCLNSCEALATLLLNAFINNNGYISSKDYYGSKFEVPGKTYMQWIHELKEARAIVQFKSEGNKKSDFIRFSPGPLIIEYINAEKLKTKEMATLDLVPLIENVPTKAEFDELKAEAIELKVETAELRARMCKVEETVSELQAAMEPPDTDEKQRRRKAATERLTQLTLIKSN